MTYNFKPLFLTAVISVFLLSSCSEYGQKNTVNSGPVQKIENIHMFELKNSSVSWTLDASKVEIFDNSEKANLTNPVMNFKDGKKVSSRIIAENGELDFKNQIVKLRKAVAVKSAKENIKLKTQRLNYSINDEIIWTDDKIVLSHDEVIIKGKGFKAKADLSEITIENQEAVLPHKK